MSHYKQLLEALKTMSDNQLLELFHDLNDLERLSFIARFALSHCQIQSKKEEEEEEDGETVSEYFAELHNWDMAVNKRI